VVELLNGIDDDGDGKTDEGYWAMRFSVSFSTLSAKQSTCSSGNSFGLPCNSASQRYCAAKGYTGGLGLLGPGTPVVLCIADAMAMSNVSVTSTLAMFHSSCSASDTISLPCSWAIHGFCESQGFGGGFGPVEQLDDGVTLLCTDHVELKTVSYADLQQKVSSCNNIGSTHGLNLDCRRAIDLLCQSMGYTSGYGPLKLLPSQLKAQIACVYDS
jgi:hypothetical protein